MVLKGVYAAVALTMLVRTTVPFWGGKALGVLAVSSAERDGTSKRFKPLLYSYRIPPSSGVRAGELPELQREGPAVYTKGGARHGGICTAAAATLYSQTLHRRSKKIAGVIGIRLSLSSSSSSFFFFCCRRYLYIRVVSCFFSASGGIIHLHVYK